MKDTCICPDCQIELEVNGLYGDNLECSKCGCKLSVFPDDDMYISTPFGTFGVSFIQGRSSLKELAKIATNILPFLSKLKV